MPMMLLQTEDTPRIPEADGQIKTKKRSGRWEKIRVESASKYETRTRIHCLFF